MLTAERSPKLETDLKQLAHDVVRRAMAGGASAAEAVVHDGSEFSTVVRLGEVETLKEAGSHAMGLRVFFGRRSASTHTSDLSADGLRQLVEGALALARLTSEDPHAGLPEPELLGRPPAICNSTLTTCTRCPPRSASPGRAAPRPPPSAPIRAFATQKAARSTLPTTIK